MSTLFVAPLDCTVTSPNTSNGSPDNLSNDHPALTWRGAVSGTITIDLGPDPVSYDMAALIGTNLRTSDTIRVQTGTASGTMNGYDSGTVAAWTGVKMKKATAKAIFPLSTLRTERFIRITYTATGHPDGYVEIQRLVIGKAVRTAGVTFGAKLNVEDRSVITVSPGYTFVDRYDRVPVWEISTSGITDQQWREEWFPLLIDVGSSSGVLFVRDHATPATFQTDALYGRVTSKAYGEAKGFDWWTFSGTIQAYAP